MAVNNQFNGFNGRTSGSNANQSRAKLYVRIQDWLFLCSTLAPTLAPTLVVHKGLSFSGKNCAPQ